MSLTRVMDDLPADFERMRSEARLEGFRHLERLSDDWRTGQNRFSRHGEALMIVRIEEDLAGVGGISMDPTIPGAFRMRRFYVRTPYRRLGIARTLARALTDRLVCSGSAITVNAGTREASAFWESLGFQLHPCDNHTHILIR